MIPLELHVRKNLTPSQRQNMFDDHKGICVICGFGIDFTERWRDEHIRALALGGSNDLSNRGPAHERCSLAKDKTDVSRIAKAKRQRAKYTGSKRSKQTLRQRNTFKKWKSNSVDVRDERT